MKPQAQTATPPPKGGQSPFFSVIVPVYNVAPYLEECLDSVLAQTFPDWECLCTDDGSKDGSDQILDAYARRDPRFRIVHQPNAGVSAARNRALDRLRGQWVGFLDGDDVIASNWLAVFSFYAQKNVELIRLRCRYWDGGERGTVDFRESAETCCRNGQREVILWGYDHFLRYGWVWLYVVKARIAKCVRFPLNMRLQEDNIFNLQLLPYVRKVCQGEYAGYFYRTRIGSAVNSKSLVKDRVRFILECIDIFNNQKKIWESNGIFDECRYNLALMASRAINDCALTENVYRGDLYRSYIALCTSFWGHKRVLPVRGWQKVGFWWYVHFGDMTVLRASILSVIWLGRLWKKCKVMVGAYFQRV